MRKSLAGASLTRTIGVPGFAMAASVASRAVSCTELYRSRGTEGSNLLPSSGESIANLFELEDVGPRSTPPMSRAGKFWW